MLPSFIHLVPLRTEQWWTESTIYQMSVCLTLSLTMEGPLLFGEAKECVSLGQHFKACRSALDGSCISRSGLVFPFGVE